MNKYLPEENFVCHLGFVGAPCGARSGELPIN